jgi:hypothetical protein
LPLALKNKFVEGWPDADDPRCLHVTLPELLTEDFDDDDRHYSQYDCSHPRRHTVAILTDPELAAKADVRMVLAVFDVDPPGHVPSDEWGDDQANRIDALLEAHPGGYVHATRAGYRVLYTLPSPVPIRTPADAAQWTARYEAWWRYLARRFGIVVDPSLKAWQQPVRAPNTKRDGVFERAVALGDPRAIGVWDPPLTKEDSTPMKRVAKTHGAVAPVPIDDPHSDYGQMRIKDAIRYLREAPLSIEGQGGRTTFFGVCCCLMRRLRLPEELAAELVERVYNPRLLEAGTTPWDPGDIEVRLESAASTATVVPPGDILCEDMWRRENEALRKIGAARTAA